MIIIALSEGESYHFSLNLAPFPHRLELLNGKSFHRLFVFVGDV